MLEAPKLNTYIVDTWEAFLHLREYAEMYENVPFALDLETDHKNEKKAKIHGIGVCWNPDEAFYIPIRTNQKQMVWKENEWCEIFEWVYQQCKKQKLIGQNIIYDALVWEYNTGYRLSEYIHSDTILLKHCIDEERPFGLKEVAVKYLGSWADKAQEVLKENVKKNGGKITQDEFEIWKADLDIISEYCSWDCLLTRRLFDIFDSKLKEEGLEEFFYTEEVMPLYREVTINMKRQGFTVDVPYFQKLQREIYGEIREIEDSIHADIKSLVADFEVDLLNESYPIKRGGNCTFPKVLADMHGVELPMKDGKPSLAKKALETLAKDRPEHAWFYDWALSKTDFLAPSVAAAAQREWFFRDNPESRYVFNLESGDHLRWLLFEKLGETPLGKTDGGKAKCDDDFLETIKDKHSFVAKLVDVKKLYKLASTYIDGILERQIDGVLYSSMLQFGTTSGRYSSTDPNLQNLPRVKEDDAGLSERVLKYTNAIKQGFIVPPGFKIVNADYSALEPRCFAHVSGDERLRDVFRQDLDLYSTIAIDVFGLSDCSADPKAKNYLKKLYPEKRQLAKIFCLAVVYGAEAGRIAKSMGIDYKDAELIIEAYLDAYPELRKYMDRCDYQATKNGFVKSQFGRLRHLPQAKRIFKEYGNKLLNKKWAKANGLDEVRYVLKNALNNAKNFPIQSLAAHIANRAMIATQRRFIEEGLAAHVVIQVHDEITCVAREDHAERAAQILQECMEQTTVISIPLVAEPMIAGNWAEAK